MSHFTVRPSGSEKDPFRIMLTATSLLSLKLRPGNLCTLSLLGEDDAPITRTAIAWENSGGGMKDTIVQTSKLLQETYGLKLGDKIAITRSAEQLQDAVQVVLCPLTPFTDDEEKTSWKWLAPRYLLDHHKILAPSQKIILGLGSVKREFEVVDVGGPLAGITNETVISISQATSSNQTSSQIQMRSDDIGGLQTQISEVNGIIRDLLQSRSTQTEKWDLPSHGILLYGPKGVGKSLFQQTVARAGWPNVVQWTPGTKVTATASPRLIEVSQDDVRKDSKAVLELVALFEKIQHTQTLVVGTARHPNDVSERLRTLDTFATELELPIPDADQRHSILRVLRGESQRLSDTHLQKLAQRTHGYVGVDLAILLRRIGHNARRRHDQQRSTDGDLPNGSTDTDEPPPPLVIVDEDIEFSLSRTRPSALQGIFLEKPRVRWTDIGGQQSTKRRLQNAVEWPLTKGEQMRKLGLEATKGILLYGPPGCSKTLLVRAVATEADLNFLAVKGAELISMYVGESERATREVFAKARAAKPSIIFFDEIDAIASRGRSGSDLNVLTTLLNEMDGFEELQGVLVIAATNKPQSIDPALMRPGRFDNVVYIGLPDFETRKDIFDKRFSGISVEDLVRSSTADYANYTDGFSGAEVVAICKAAGESALSLDRDMITTGDVMKAITEMPKGVTKGMLDEYETWNAARKAL